ncbi:tetratricopeptide repeat protein [Hymenobacter sp. IS2118]|uniref:tetratricopeptide repeat protein n=1 Tax=Hymenobacter sp. IS2118 TaxID=1505605 RepID=UPI00055446DE|nr:tetratricopeptide repeat protein [Hymenobacter sp. IS2118]
MTRYEKYLLYLLLSLLVLQATGISTSNTYLWLCIWLLALSYIVGGRWLFKDQQAFSTSFYVVAGICLGTSLVSLSFTLRVRHEPLEVLLPVLNGIFCVGLGIYFYRHRAHQPEQNSLRGLWLRSAVLLVFAGFFASTPISFTPYRLALLAFNRGDVRMTSNLLMHHHRIAAQEAMRKKDYAAAISNARKSYFFGNRWLGSDSISRKNEISGAYKLAYEAYEGRGDAAFAKKEFAEALQAYQQGHSFLIRSDNRAEGATAPSPYWEEEKAWSLRNMADCHLGLGAFAACDSLFIAALNAYKLVNPRPDLPYARIASGLARSYTAQNEPGLSTTIYRRINRYLATDSAREAAEELLTNRIRIVGNSIQQDSLAGALRELSTLSFAPGDTSNRRFDADIYNGICLYKLGQYAAAERALRAPWRFYRERAERNWEALAVAEMLLANNSLAQGRYAETQTLATAALGRIEQKRGSASSAYATCLRVVAALNKALGQYSRADQQLRQVLSLVRKDPNASGTEPEVLAQLAELDLIFGRDAAAQATIGKAVSLLTAGKPIALPRQTGILATAAYVDYATGNYPAAQAKYRQVLAINAKFEQAQTAASAAAWNGLGLLATSQHQLTRADSLLTEAVRLHERLFTKRNPLTGTVYLNFGQLRRQQGRLAEAEQLLQQALGIAQAFLPKQHDQFGDLALAFGDLAQRQQRPTAAQTHYQQALDIYSRKFGEAHWKTRLARQKASASVSN